MQCLVVKRHFITPDETMKIRLLVALVGLAISFALPAFAQQTDTPDPQLREKLIAVIKKHTDALDKNDAVAVAANFTEDAVSVEQDGPASVGRPSRNFGQTGSRKCNSATISLRPMSIPHTLVRMVNRCGRPDHGVRLLKARIGVLKTSRDTGQ
jgi:hypothetical protein